MTNLRAIILLISTLSSRNTQGFGIPSISYRQVSSPLLPRSSLHSSSSYSSRRRTRCTSSENFTLSRSRQHRYCVTDSTSKLHFAAASMDPEVEVEVLSDLGHLFCDIAVFITPETFLIRFAALCGRLLFMASDWAPDHYIRPDELIFQVMMLLSNIGLAGKSAYPLLKSMFVPTSDRDQDIYRRVFEPVGVTWVQYKEIAATCVDWIKIEPYSTIISEEEDMNEGKQKEEFMHWLYDGKVELSYRGSELYSIARAEGESTDEPETIGILADMKFLYNIDKQRITKITDGIYDDEATPLEPRREQYQLDSTILPEQYQYPLASANVGANGGVIFRINCSRLLDLMANDEQLSTSIRKLLIKNIQKKIGTLLKLSDPLLNAKERYSDRSKMYDNRNPLSPDNFS